MTADLSDFLARAGTRLRPVAPTALHSPGDPSEHGDHFLNDEAVAAFVRNASKAAAVLIPVVARPGGPTVLFTERAGSLRNHSGQIAFPGGRIDDGDDGPLAAALRESEEEIGLDRALVRPLGYLDLYLTGSGYRIAPVVGVIEPGFTPTLNPDEVADIFECPLAFLMDPANHRIEEREWRGFRRRAFAMPWGERHIWGVTAGIVRQLYERIYG